MSPDIFPKNKFFTLFLIVSILFLLTCRLNYLPLKYEEPRRALIATEMLISSSLWSPTVNGAFYYNKPPLFNWILAGFFKTFGFHNWVERLPTLLAIIGISLVNFFFFRKRIGQQIASVSSIFFVLSGHMLFYFSFQGEIDMTYSFVVYLQAICIIHGFEKKRWNELFICSYLLMTIGFMMKGLPSIVFQGLTLIGIFASNKAFKKLFQIPHITGIILSSSLLFGYFYMYSFDNNPELLLAKLTVESTSRTTAASSVADYIFQLGKFPLLIFIIMLPGSTFLLLGRKYQWKQMLENKWIKYCLIFVAFNIPLYWVSPGTRDRYIYMFLPFLYNILFFLAFKSINQYGRQIRLGLFILSWVLVAGLMVIPFFIESIPFHWTMIAVFLMLTICFLLHKRLLHNLLGIMLIMMALRLYYDQVVFPIRALSEHNIAATEHAGKVCRLTQGKDLVFFGDSQKTEVKLPFRKPVTIKEIERLPHQFSYYYSSAVGKIIKWTDHVPENQSYITSQKNAIHLPVCYTFQMEGRTFVLVD